MNNPLPNDSDFGQVHFAWTFSEFPQYQRDRRWYMRAAVVTAIFLLYAILDPRISLMKPYLSFSGPNYLFAFLIILFALVISLHHRSDNTLEFKITEDGIMLNQRLYPYQEIRNFYIIYDPPAVKTLYFEPKSFFNPRIPVHLEDQDPVAIREVLNQYLSEDLEREDEPVSDHLSRLLKL